MTKSERDVAPDTAQRLSRQAQEIRRISSARFERLESALAPWQQILGVPLVVLVLGSSVALLVAGDLRGKLLERITTSWLAAFEQPPHVYHLPPPPPKESQVELRFPSQPIPVVTPGVVPVGGAVLGSAYAPKSGPAEFSPPVKDAAWEAAFRVLQEESEVVASLIEGEVNGLRFSGWEPLRVDASLYSIRLDMVRDSEQGIVPFAWSVDVSSRQTRPENQEARDLFFKLRRK